MLYGASRVASRSSLFVATLIILFIISFSLPLIVTLRWRQPFTTSSQSAADADSLFPHYTAVQSGGQRIEITDSTGLDPAAGRDFIVSGWFKLARPLQAKEKVLFIGKADSLSEPQAGYIVGLSRDSDTIRPIVYWGDAHKSKWYSFSDISIAAQSWFMLVLSFQEGKYLGMHIAIPGADRKTDLKLLGGYEVEDGVTPASSGPFVAGTWGDGKFKGRIGPFGIFSAAELGDNLKNILKSLARNPEELPAAFSSKEVMLWVPRGLQDESPAKRNLQALATTRKRS